MKRKIKKDLCLFLVFFTFCFALVSPLTVKASAPQKMSFSEFYTYDSMEAAKFIDLIIMELGAIFNGDLTNFMANYNIYLESKGNGGDFVYDDGNGNYTIDEDLINSIKEYLETQKDASGKYTSDSNLAGVDYQIIRTNTFEGFWNDYMLNQTVDGETFDFLSWESYLEYYAFYAKYKDSTGFEHCWDKPSLLVNRYLLPNRRDILSDLMSHINLELYPDDYIGYIGSLQSTGKWTFSEKIYNSDTNIVGLPNAYFLIYNKSGLVNQDQGPLQVTTQAVNPTKGDYAQMYIQAIATKSGYLRLFLTDNDFKNYCIYFNQMKQNTGYNVNPDNIYTGGNIYITNEGDVYNNYYPEVVPDPDVPEVNIDVSALENMVNSLIGITQNTNTYLESIFKQQKKTFNAIDSITLYLKSCEKYLKKLSDNLLLLLPAPDNPDLPSVPDGNTGYTNILQNIYDKLDSIRDKLDGIYNQIFVGNVISALDLVYDVVSDMLDEGGDTINDVCEVAKNKFPFCIPAVIVTAIALTSVTAVAPTFEIPFKYDLLNVDYKIVIDFADPMWAGCRQVVWYFSLFLFVIGLIHLTIKVAGMRRG